MSAYTYEIIPQWRRAEAGNWRDWEDVHELEGRWKITGEAGYEYQAILGVIRYVDDPAVRQAAPFG